MSSLQILGLSAPEEQFYEWLLTHSPVSLDEIEAGIADQPPTTDLAAALMRLEELRLVVLLPEDPPRYLTVSPEVAFEALAVAAERVLAQGRRQRAELAAAFHGAARPDPVRLVEVVHGRQAIADRYVQLQRGASREVRIFDAPPYVARAPTVNTLELDLLRRGFRYRVLYDRRGLELPGRLAGLKAGLAMGEQARVTDVPLTLVLSDYPGALLPLQLHPAGVESSLVVHDSVLLDALSALFEMYWDRAIPLQVSNDRVQVPEACDTPTAVDGELLPLLAAGLHDQAIATQLGCSERTARRYIKDMMRRLDAATRFQAGYQAVQRGWLAADGNGTA